MKKYKNKPNIKVEEDYNLKIDAVNTLADALKEGKVKQNTDELPESKKKNPYKIDFIAKIPSWIKILFIKFWVGGAICFFFFFGLGLYVTNILDLMVITGVATGLINDLLVTKAFLYFETDKKEYHKYLFLPISNKKLWTLLINIPLGILEIYFVSVFYKGLNLLIASLRGLEVETITIHSEPLLFGLFFLIVDMLLVLIKNIFVKIFKDASIKARKEK